MITSSAQPGPDMAERARTVLSYAPTAVLEAESDLTVVLDVVAVDADGSLVLLVAADGVFAERVAGRPLLGRVCSALVTPVPAPDRLFDSVVVHGAVEFADDVGSSLEVVLGAYPDRPVDVVLRPDASALLRMGSRRCA